MLLFLKHKLNNYPYIQHELVKKKKTKKKKKKTNKPTKTTMKRLLTFINISHEEES